MRLFLCLLMAQSVFAQRLVPAPLIQAIDANANPISGAKLHIGDAGSSTDRSTYADASLETENANPLTAEDNVSFSDGGSASINATDFGTECDGATDDSTALQAALTAGAGMKVVFSETDTCAFDTALTIPSSANIDFNGTTLRRSGTDATDSFQISVGARAVIRNLILEIPSGVQIERGITITDGAKAYNVKVTSTDQQNNLGRERACFNVNGDDTVVDHLVVENCDKAIRFEDSADGRWSNILVSSYATGMAIHDSTRFTLTNYIAHTKSPNGSTSSGHAGITLENPNYAKLSNIQIADAGEHCIYHSVGATSEYVSYSNLQLSKCGQSGLKISGQPPGGSGDRAQHVTVTGLEAVDMSTGNSAGQTEHALMIEQADWISVSGFSTYKDDDSDHAFNGIYIRDSTNVVVAAPSIEDVKSHGIILTDEDEAEVIQDIYILSPRVSGPATDADCFHIDMDTTGSKLGNIIVTDLYCAAPGGYGATVNTLSNNILQPVFVQGIVRSPVTGVYNNVTGTTNELLNVRLGNAESYEAPTCNSLLRGCDGS